MKSDEDIKARLELLASWLDSKFVIPGTRISFGLDSLIGLIPGVGDTITGAVSLYIIKLAHQLGIPWHVKIRMLWNVFIDWIVGFIPLVGDIFDVGFKANQRNVHLTKKYLERKESRSKPPIDVPPQGR